MQLALKEKLWAYIIENNPDLMFELQETYSVGKYLDDKVALVIPMLLELFESNTPRYAILELCLSKLTADLKPSKFHRMVSILAESFNEEYTRLKENGLLTFEGVNLVEHCKEVFEEFEFHTENEKNPALDFQLVEMITKYFDQVNF